MNTTTTRQPCARAQLRPVFGGLLMSVLATLVAAGEPTPSGPAPSTPSPMEAGIALFRHSQYREARAVFEKISAAEPGNAAATFYLGWTAFRLKEPEESVKFLEKATALDGTKALYFHVLGDAYGTSARRASVFAKFGLAKKCLAAYDRGVAVDPADVDVRVARYGYYRGAPAIAGGGMDKAYAEAGEICHLEPVVGTPLLVDLYVQEKKNDEAFALLERLVAEHPEDKFHLFHLGRLAAVTGQRLDRGAAALNEYLRTTPHGKEPPLSLAHWRLGAICEKQGDQAAARAEYEEALKSNPRLTEAREALKKLP